jgi:hypothetical protein
MPSPSRASQRNQSQSMLLPRDNAWPKRERGRTNGHVRGQARRTKDYVPEIMPSPALPTQVSYQNHNDITPTADCPRTEEGPPISHPTRDALLEPAPHVSRREHTSPSPRPFTDDIHTNRPPHQSPGSLHRTPPNMSSFKVGVSSPLGKLVQLLDGFSLATTMTAKILRSVTLLHCLFLAHIIAPQFPLHLFRTDSHPSIPVKPSTNLTTI